MLWFDGSVTAAISAAKQRNVLFVVYVRGDDDVSTEMDATWEDAEVTKLCQDSGMVAIKFNANSEEGKQFSQYYPVICVPCVSFISGETGIPLEGTAGHMSPSDFSQRIRKVLEMAKQTASASTVQASASASTPPPAATNPETAPQLSGVAQAQPSTSQSPAQPQAPPSQTLAQEQKKEMSKLEKAARLRQKMEEIHQRKEAQKEEESKKKEIERRKVGQSVQKSVQDRSDQEARRIAEEMRKEKAEDRLAKERVREQIASDRAEKQARYDMDRKEREMKQAAAKDVLKAASNAPKRKINMDVARIQFRLPDGSTLTMQFDAKAPLQEALQFLRESVSNTLREFTMSTTFPRRSFSAADMNSTFLELDLVPTAAVIVLPGRFADTPTTSSSSAVQPANSGGIIAMLLASLLFLWNMIITFIFGRPSQSEPSGQAPVQQAVPPPRSAMGARPESTQVRRRTPGGEGSTSRQEGNVHRLVTAQDDDDENKTWNGNSTQQL